MINKLKEKLLYLNRYLFWTKKTDSSLNQRYLPGNNTKAISYGLWMASIKLDYPAKRIYLITLKGMIKSMDYHGGNRIEILAKRIFHPYTIDILGNCLYLRNSSRDVFKLNLTHMTLSRLQTSLFTRLLVIDGSRQPEG